MITGIQAQRDPTAVMGLRVAAFVIDIAALVALSIAILLAAFFSMAQRSPSSQVTCRSGGVSLSSPTATTTDSSGRLHPQFCVQDGSDVLYIPVADEGTFSATFYLSGFLFGVVDLVVLQGLTGSSLGKLLVGLKVIRADGAPVGVGRALVRYLFLAVDAGCCLVGLITSFSSAGHRRVGDMAAGTLVVSKSHPWSMLSGSAGMPATAPGTASTGFPPAPGFPPANPAPSAGWPQPQVQPQPPAPEAPVISPRPSDDPSAGGDGPFWDQARDTYIQYDRAAEAWVEWDETVRAWVPISR